VSIGLAVSVAVNFTRLLSFEVGRSPVEFPTEIEPALLITNPSRGADMIGLLARAATAARIFMAPV
jgi:hypothetical protein